MKHLVASVALVLSATSLSGHALGQAPKQPPEQKVGEIIIVGNEITSDHVIRKALGLYPNQVLRRPALRAAETKLVKLGLFRSDPAKDIRPKVTLLDRGDESEFVDVLVQIEEGVTSRLRVTPGLSRNAELVLSLVWEERNFDPWRYPVCVDDLIEGRAFRGGGRLCRLELLQVPISPFRAPRLCQSGSLLLPAAAIDIPQETDQQVKYLLLFLLKQLPVIRH